MPPLHEGSRLLAITSPSPRRRAEKFSHEASGLRLTRWTGFVAELEAERSTEGFAKKKEADSRRREKAQAEYVEDFHGAVVTFLGFHGNYRDLADRLARAVTDHATPVGSGTVARTQRIPIDRRAEAAVIACAKDGGWSSRAITATQQASGSPAR
jgi:hypothetical protein